MCYIHGSVMLKMNFFLRNPLASLRDRLTHIWSNVSLMISAFSSYFIGTNDYYYYTQSSSLLNNHVN